MAQNNSQSIVEDLTPSTKTIDLAPLLDDIEKFISARMILPQGASVATTLWCAATYGINLFRIFPKLTIISPEKRCGKSTLLDLVDGFSNKALITSNITPPAIYRLIDQDQPTLIIDEADTFISNGSSDMVGIINSGHAKSKAFASRCVGTNHDVKQFSTWTPMALAAIGVLQSTIMDRSIIIPLRRKTIGDSTISIEPDLRDTVINARCQLLKWFIDNQVAIQNSFFIPPNLGNDRTVDNWAPLFTIANQASPDWLRKCEDAYRRLTGYEEEPLVSTLLLTDIRLIFMSLGSANISSANLVAKLIEDKDKPWCEIRNGGAISQNGLATMLKIYGIKPKVIRLNSSTPRGYELAQFVDAFDRYLPPV